MSENITLAVTINGKKNESEEDVLLALQDLLDDIDADTEGSFDFISWTQTKSAHAIIYAEMSVKVSVKEFKKWNDIGNTSTVSVDTLLGETTTMKHLESSVDRIKDTKKAKALVESWRKGKEESSIEPIPGIRSRKKNESAASYIGDVIAAVKNVPFNEE